jgi:hypothetical protein
MLAEEPGTDADQRGAERGSDGAMPPGRLPDKSVAARRRDHFSMTFPNHHERRVLVEIHVPSSRP